ncbi:MAG: Neutral/alkaline non-lysosomal ceramidase [Verrucomicrobiales bacterium]|nr:Neutral/alkaline non-lysosomal ceramidase [Verrucomicrobiales bacterium]
MNTSRRMLRYSLVILIFVFVAARAAESTRKQFRAGASTSNITPEIGGPIVGGFHPVPSTHIHDDLHARCLVLDNGETRMALVVCDLLGIAQEVCDAARALIHAENSIPEGNILICATHTHSASSALGKNRFAYGQPLDDYQKFLIRRIADGVRTAANNLAPARIGWGVGHNSNQAFNRRWVMKPGTIGKNPFGGTNDQVRMNPPRASKDMLRPAGPTDPEICLIALESPDGKPMALLANYSLHYAGGVPDGHISADYFAVFADRMQELLKADRKDPPFVAMLSNGTSGDINNIDFTKKESTQPPYQHMHDVANDIARSALEAYKKIKFHDWVPLDGQLQFIEIGVRHPSPEQLERAKQIVAKAGNPPVLDSFEQIYAERSLRMNEYPPTLAFPVQALRIGDAGIAGIPNEVFCETGLEIKKRSPFKPSFTMEIANGYYGYLPTPEQHKLGGYETWLGTNRLEPDGSTKYVNALLQMWRELQLPQ